MSPDEKPKKIIVRSPYQTQSQTSVQTEPVAPRPVELPVSVHHSESVFKGAVLALSATAALAGLSVEMGPPPQTVQMQPSSSGTKANDAKLPTIQNAPTTVTITYPPGVHNIEIQLPDYGKAEHQPVWDGSTSTLKVVFLGAAYLKAIEPVLLEILKRHREAKTPKSGRITVQHKDTVISVDNAEDLDKALETLEALEGSKRAAHR